VEVIPEFARVYSQASSTSSILVYVYGSGLHNPQRFIPFDFAPDWYRIYLPEKSSQPDGWVRSSDVRFIGGSGTYTLTVSKNAAQGGTVTSSPAGINCGTDCATQSASFSAGTVVTLTATAASGWQFSGWSGCDSVSGSQCTVTMNANRTVTASFTQVTPTYTLTVSKNAAQGGTVTSSPAGINCGTDCATQSASFSAGTVVTLTATAASGWQFSGWSGCDSVSGSQCTVTMNANRTVTASFTQVTPTYTLTVSKNAAQGGTVTSSPAGINCGTDCATQSASFSAGTVVTLTATAASGWQFSGWSGCDSVSGNRCTLTMTADRSVTATFTTSGSGWAKTYGGPGWDEAHSIQQTTDGGYIVAGWIAFGASYTDIWVLKLDPNGDVQWQKTYGGPNWDMAYSIQQTSDGGYIVAGMTQSFGAGYPDIWVLKLDPNGDVQWQKTYGGPYDDRTFSIQQTADGGYIVAGNTGSFAPAGYIDIWVLKLDPNGNVQWQKTYGGPGAHWDMAYSIQQTSDGGYIVAGETASFGAGDYDLWVLKLDSNGNVQWQKTYGGPYWDIAYSIQQTADGGYIVAGWTASFGAGLSDLWVLKLDPNGDVQWQKTYGGPDWDFAYSIQQTTDGGYIVAGLTYSFGAGFSDLWVLKLDANGG